MALPKLDTPTYRLTLPSTGEEIKYRPFLVKEEKLMLMAIEGGDNTEILKTTKQIINNCVTGIDVENSVPSSSIKFLIFVSNCVKFI